MDTRNGLSILELLVVLAILGIVAGIALALVRPSAGRSAAIAIAGEITAARLRALTGGVPIAVTLSSERRRVERRTGSAGGAAPDACAAGTAELVVDLAAYPRVTVPSGLERGVVWFPAGWGRSCDGGGVYNGRIVVRDPWSQHAVVVSTAGRVRWEVVP